MPTRTLLLGALIGLNAVLGVTLFVRTHNAQAYAQVRARADFITVAGHANGGPCLYVMDANTGRMAALQVNVNNQTITAAGVANVGDVLTNRIK